MTCEHFAKGDSLFHRADPRIKILLALFLSLEVVFINDFFVLFLAVLSAIFMLCMTGISKVLILRRILVVNVFVIALWLILPWTTPGTSIFQIGPVHITWQGLVICMAITLKCNAIVMFNMALLSTSTIFALSHALDHLKVPQVLVQLFFFSWRYLHVLEEEYSKIKRAALLRGFRPKTSFFTYKTYANILGTLFVRSYDRGQRVYWAMVCRGFNGTFWLLSHFEFGRTDLFLTSAVLFLGLCLLAIEWSRNCLLYN